MNWQEDLATYYMTWIPKLDEESTAKENYKSVSFMNLMFQNQLY
jgi:hypothetical protein